MCLSTESCQPSCSSCSTGYQCLSAPAPTTAPPTYTWTDNADHSCGRATSIGEVKLEVWHSMDDCKLACHAMSGCQAIQIKKTELLKCVMFDHCELTADAEYDQAWSPTFYPNVVTWEARDKHRCNDKDVALTPGSIKSEAECRLACIREYSCTAIALNRGDSRCNLYASCSPVADSMFVQASSTTTAPTTAPTTTMPPTTVPPTYKWTDNAEHSCGRGTTIGEVTLEVWHSADDCKLACHTMTGCTATQIKKTGPLLCKMFDYCELTADAEYDQASSPTWFSNVVTWEAKDKFRCDDTGNDVALTPGSVKSEAECRLACITEYSCTATALNRGTGVCNLYASCSPVADSMFVQASSTTRTPVSWTEPKEGWCDDSYPDTTMLRPQFEKFWTMDQCKLACQDNSDCTTISWADETEICSLFSTCSPSSSGQATYTETAVVGPYDKCALWNGGATWCNSNCVSDMWGAVCRLSVGLNGGGCVTIGSCGGE